MVRVRRISRGVLGLAVAFGLGTATTYLRATPQPSACGWVLWMSTVTAIGIDIKPKKWTTLDALDSREACLTTAAAQMRAMRARQNVPPPAEEFLEAAFSSADGPVPSTSFVSLRCFPSDLRPQ